MAYPTQLTIDGLRQVYLDYYVRQGHTVVAPSSLVHPAFRTSFVMSAGVIDMEESLFGTVTEPLKRVLVQPCFRHFDLNRSSGGRHLSLFEMGGSLYFQDSSREVVIEHLVKLFINDLGLEPGRLWLSAFAGGLLGNRSLPPDTEAVRVWNSLGMPPEQTVLLGEADNLWQEGHNSGSPASGIGGPHAELFYDRGQTADCSSTVCRPGCQCGRFLELANAVFPEFRINGCEVTPLPRLLAEAAVGLERVLMILEGVPTVFDVSAFRPLFDCVVELLGVDGGSDAAIRVIIDHMRAFCCLVSQGAQPRGKGKGHEVRKLVRGAWATAAALELKPRSVILGVTDLLADHSEATAGIDVAKYRTEIRKTLEGEFHLLEMRTVRRART